MQGTISHRILESWNDSMNHSLLNDSPKGIEKQLLIDGIFFPFVYESNQISLQFHYKPF